MADLAQPAAPYRAAQAALEDGQAQQQADGGGALPADQAQHADESVAAVLHLAGGTHLDFDAFGQHAATHELVVDDRSIFLRDVGRGVARRPGFRYRALLRYFTMQK